MKSQKAYFHLPGLFEFYELYSLFIPLFFEHREYFYDFCEIGSIYGAPGDCLWGGGRVGYGENSPDDVLRLIAKYGISARLTFSNSLLRPHHLCDARCNALCKAFQDKNNGIILSSDLLLSYIKEKYPDFYLVSSTTKVITDFTELTNELDREDFSFVVPDFRLNKSFKQLEGLSQKQKDKVEFLCNECCYFGCNTRKACYENVSRIALGESPVDFACSSPNADEGYVFSKAMENPGFIGIDDIKNVYLPMGFSHFKLEGRSLGSALVLEFLLHYMTKPQYQLHVREKIYLNHSLDLF